MRAEGEQTDEVILSRVNACAPPHPTMYMGSGDVKQKRRVRRACRSKTEGEGAHGSRHMKPASVGEICSAIFCSRNGSAPKSQTPKSLSAVSSRRVSVAARRSSRINTKYKNIKGNQVGESNFLVPSPLLAKGVSFSRDGFRKTPLSPIHQTYAR